MEYTERVVELLKKSGYLFAGKGAGQENRIIVMSKTEKERVSVVLLADDTGSGLLVSADGTHEWLNRVYNAMKKTKQGKDFVIILHLVVISDNVSRTRENVWENDSFWISDVVHEKVVIYENQRDENEFPDLKECLEGAFDSRYSDSLKQMNRKAVRRRLKIAVQTVNFWLILINILVFIIGAIIEKTLGQELFLTYGSIVPHTLFYPSEWYRLFTAFFLHFSWEHLASNMIALGLMGTIVERFTGRWKYLGLYLGAGMFSSICSIVWYDLCIQNYHFRTAGASGAIFGVLGALAVICILHRKERAVPIRNLVICILISLSSGFFTGSTVNNVAHISGFIFGMVISLAVSGIKYLVKLLTQEDKSIEME